MVSTHRRENRLRVGFGLTLIILVAAALVHVPASTQAASGVAKSRYAVGVYGDTAHGWIFVPRQGVPTKLIVFAHGCCGAGDPSWVLEALASHHNAVAVAMDYRGNGRWNVWAGKDDVIAATIDLKRRFPIQRTVLWGMS